MKKVRGYFVSFIRRLAGADLRETEKEIIKVCEEIVRIGRS